MHVEYIMQKKKKKGNEFYSKIQIYAILSKNSESSNWVTKIVPTKTKPICGDVQGDFFKQENRRLKELRGCGSLYLKITLYFRNTNSIKRISRNSHQLIVFLFVF